MKFLSNFIYHSWNQSVDQELDFVESGQDFSSPDYSYEKPNNDFPDSLFSKNENQANFSNENISRENENDIFNLNNFESFSFNKIQINEKYRFFLQNFIIIPSHLCNESLKIQKRRKKWDNFSFHVPEYIKFMDVKSQRKEIQKLKNRISAQISRDKKKQEFESIQTLNYNLEEQNKKLLEDLTLIQQENQILMQKLHDFKCNKCGFCNSDSDNVSETNESSGGNLLNSPMRIPISRTSSYSVFLGTLTILGALTLFCVATSFYSTDRNMRNINMFTQINQTKIPQYQCKNFFLNNEKDNWKEKTMYIFKKKNFSLFFYLFRKLRNNLVGELISNGVIN